MTMPSATPESPEEEYRRAMDGALRLLKFRDRGEKEMARRLLEKGFSQNAVDRAVNRLKEWRLLDDQGVALRMADARRRAGHGDRRVRRELAERGLPPETVDAALSRGEETDRERLDRMLKKWEARARALAPAVARRRLFGRLSRQGFSAEDIHSALRRFFSTQPIREDSEP